MSPMPNYMKRHPCSACETGYGACAQGYRLNLKCCKGCDHPTRWTDQPPYSDEDRREMAEGSAPEGET